MSEIILWIVIYILLFGYGVLIRCFRKNQSNPRSPARLIDSMRSRHEKLKLHIEQQREEIASLLTEIEQLKEVSNGNVGYVIDRNNKEIQSLKKEIWRLQEECEKLQSLQRQQESDGLFNKYSEHF